MAATTPADPPYDDLWEWDGYDWYQVTPETGLPPLDGHGMCYDASRGCTVLFGGTGLSYSQDTWEYTNTDDQCCDTLGVTLSMPATHFHPGDTCSCTAVICNNTGMTLTGYPLFVVLDVYGALFWGPDFTDEFQSYLSQYPQFPQNETEITIIPPFTWPDTGSSATGITFYAAVTDPTSRFHTAPSVPSPSDGDRRKLSIDNYQFSMVAIAAWKIFIFNLIAGFSFPGTGNTNSFLTNHEEARIAAGSQSFHP